MEQTVQEEQTSLHDKILDYLRANEGAITDAEDNVNQKLATRLGVVDVLTLAEVLHALRKQGLVHLIRNTRIEITSLGWQRDYVDEPAAPPPSVEPPTVSHKEPEPPKGRAPRPRSTTGVAIVEYLRRQGGRVDDPRGGCIKMLATAVGAKDNTVHAAVIGLVKSGLVKKDTRGRIGTVSIELTEGASNGDVSKLRSADRVGAQSKRKTAAVRREAGQGRRAVGRPAGAQARAREGGRAVRKGGRRVHPSSHDLPAGGPVAADDALAAYIAIVERLKGLQPGDRARVLEAIRSSMELA